MRRILGAGLAGLTLLAATATPSSAQDASDLTGRWEITRQGGPGGREGGRPGGGPRGVRGGGGGPQVLTLVQEGQTLTGSIETPRGPVEIEDGRVDGTDVSFKITMETPRGTVEAVYTGTITTEGMSGTMQGPGGRFTVNWTAKRVET